jgi:hypothetical protein
LQSRPAFQVGNHIGNIEAVIITALIDIARYKPGISIGAFALIRRRRTSLKIRNGIAYIQTIEISAVIDIAGGIMAVGLERFDHDILGVAEYSPSRNVMSPDPVGVYSGLLANDIVARRGYIIIYDYNLGMVYDTPTSVS